MCQSYISLSISCSLVYVRNHKHLPFGREKSLQPVLAEEHKSAQNAEAKVWVAFSWKDKHGDNPLNWFVQDSHSPVSYVIEQGAQGWMMTCRPSPVAPDRPIPFVSSRSPELFSQHTRISSNRCYSLFKECSREISKSPFTADTGPLKSTLRAGNTLLPAVNWDLTTKWFLQPNHTGEAKDYFHWPKTTLAVIT